MVLGLTDRGSSCGSTSFLLSRPARRSPARMPLDGSSHDVAASRHGLVTGFAFALTNGQIVEVEAMRGRRLRHFADAHRHGESPNGAAGHSVAAMTTLRTTRFPDFRHAGATDAEMFDHTVAHTRSRPRRAASSRCG